MSLSNASGKLARCKAVWRDQLYADPGLTPSAFRLGYGMADFITMRDTAARFRRHGEIVIFPSQQTLRDKANLSLDTVGAGIAQLIAGGHLRRLTRGNQHIGSNHYKVIVKESRR